MKTETITSKNLKWFWNLFETEDEVNEVVKYLEENNVKITVRETYDSQSGWRGKSVFLDGRDLSGNGFCFTGKALLTHVRLYKKYKALETNEDYKKYLELKKEFGEIERIFNR